MERAGCGGKGWCGGSHCAAGQLPGVWASDGDGVHVEGGGDLALWEVRRRSHGFGLPEKQGRMLVPTFSLKNTPSHSQAGQRTKKQEKQKTETHLLSLKLESWIDSRDNVATPDLEKLLPLNPQRCASEPRDETSAVPEGFQLLKQCL